MKGMLEDIQVVNMHCIKTKQFLFIGRKKRYDYRMNFRTFSLCCQKPGHHRAGRPDRQTGQTITGKRRADGHEN
jgi:hypothetical protein